MMLKNVSALFLTLFLQGCTAVGLAVAPEREIENILESEFGSLVYSNELCQSIEVGCFGPKYYNEWRTPTGEVKCQCQ